MHDECDAVRPEVARRESGAVLEQQQLRLAKPGGQVRCRALSRLSDLNLLALCRRES